MENFEALQNIDNFCKVIVKKTTMDKTEKSNENKLSREAIFERTQWNKPLGASSAMGYNMQPEIEDPLVDVFDEEDHVRILVQCRCREQQVTFHPSPDGITVCREECHKEKGSPEKCSDVCRKLTFPTSKLQLENMEFVVAKCNNNNTLEAMIPKMKK